MTILMNSTENKKAFVDKFHQMAKERESSLHVSILCQNKSTDGDIHVLCYRQSDNSYIVWTAYYTGCLSNSFEGFYNGRYDLTLEEALNEIERRTGHICSAENEVQDLVSIPPTTSVAAAKAQKLSPFIEDAFEISFEGEIAK